MKKILLFGATGMAGHVIYYYLRSTGKYDISNVVYRTPLTEDSIVVDVTSRDVVTDVVHRVHPEIIINCIGILIRGSKEHPDNAILINAYFPHLLKRLSDEVGAKLIHISTDCVFSGKKGHYTEDDFLSYLAFEMFRRGQYDKVTLTYLAEYYCGAIGDMKRLWKVLKQYGVPSYKVSERIITQMVFAETLYKEEHIFEDYYLSDNVYFRLKQAYLAYVSREYIVYGRNLEKCVFEIIANECDQKEDLPDVCKIALLKYYSDKEYTGELEDVLHQVLREMCEKQLVFPYYMNYKEEWLREVQLYNKVMAAYRCKPGGKVRLYYKMKQKDREELGYRAEAMMPVYENLYVKQFVLYNDESVNYYFQESGNGEMITTDKKTLKTDKERVFAGKYQMLNAMTDMDSDAERSKAMLEFEEEEQMADQIFKIY